MPARAFAAFACGLVAMYGPVFLNAARHLWNTEEQAHGPLILLVSAWWFWHRRDAFLRALDPAGGGVLAWATFLVGLTIFAIGRAHGAWILQISSIAVVLAGGLAVLAGWRAVMTVRFAILFTVFAIPLPGLLVSELTGPLKREVSIVADELLYRAGYAVARDGVVLSLGQYKLLIADACSGLNSMVSLLALAVVFAAAVRDAPWPRNALLLLASLPIALLANVTRVVILCLVTFHMGDAAGQGFLHGAAGLMMFLVTLVLLYLVDQALSFVWATRPRQGDAGAGAKAAA